MTIYLMLFSYSGKETYGDESGNSRAQGDDSGKVFPAGSVFAVHDKGNDREYDVQRE